MDKFTEFVLEHEGDVVESLVLQKGRWPEIDVAKAADTIAGRRKMRVKVPSWWKRAELVYPSRLCTEQCSSEAASEIKAEIIATLRYKEKHFSRPKIADLTGGLGVDSWAFSKVAEKVLYVERDEVLAEAAKQNFSVLGCNNIEVVNAEVSPEGFVGGEAGSSSGFADSVDSDKKDKRETDGWEVLRKFAPDVIYLDPSRRGGAGEKVFKLEDCRPNILELRDKLLEIAGLVVVKLSPMADIDEVVRQLGPCCLRADVISVDGECKEVMVTMERGYKWECLIGVNCGKCGSFAFLRSDEATAVPHYLSLPPKQNPKTSTQTDIHHPTQKSKNHVATPTDYSSLVGKILLEPDKAVMKAAPFKLLSEMYGLVKLDVSTHYYIDGDCNVCDESDRNTKEAGDSVRDEEIDKPEKIRELFRQFKILRAVPLNKRTIRTISHDYPHAEVTARNIPLSSDELRKRLAVSGSDIVHIFGLRVAGQNLLLVTERVQ